MRTSAKILCGALCALSFNFFGCGKKSLRNLAAKKDLMTGIAVAPGDIYAERESSILKNDCSIIVSENGMKLGNLRPSATFWNWSDIDHLVQFAEENKMKVKWHTFFWHNQNPAFLGNMKTREDALKMMDEIIEKVMTRYKGKIEMYDIVNEMFEENGSMRNTVWYRLAGPDYIEYALTKARSVDPDTKLYLNEYNNEEMGNAKADAMYSLVKSLKEKNVPLDGVGMQLHLSSEYNYNFDAIRDNIRRYADLGIDISFSEVDVRMPLKGGRASAEDLEKQTAIYKNLMRLAIEEPNVKSIVFWNISDKVSWIPGNWPGLGQACLYDREYKPKPVYDELLKMLK